MPAPPLLLLRVAATWHLPGLGLLVLPDGATPHLAGYPLHTALAVELVPAVGPRHATTATVEEITRANQVERGLLLSLDTQVEILVGTGIWLAA